MSNTKAIVTAALSSLIALGTLSASAQANAADKPEKCYGVVKAGKNDCQTSSHSCAGQVKQDGQGDSWIYLPKGTCEKIVGGSVTPKS